MLQAQVVTVLVTPALGFFGKFCDASESEILLHLHPQALFVFSIFSRKLLRKPKRAGSEDTCSFPKVQAFRTIA